MLLSILLPFLLAVNGGLSISPSSYKKCIIPSQYIESNGTADDSAAISNAFDECSSHAIIEFSEGVNYNVFQPISKTNLSNVVIYMLGNLHLPQNITAVQSVALSVHLLPN